MTDIKKNSREVIRIENTKFKSYKLTAIRVYYLDTSTDTYKPTKKGITFNRELLPEVIKELQKLDKLEKEV